MGVTFSLFFPPAPALTEANLPRQDGKVFIVTGGASGIGRELCAILYHAGAKVYLAGRSEAKAAAAIEDIKSRPRPARAPGTGTGTDTDADMDTPGELIFLYVALDDLATIKPAVERFMAAESRLDVLFHNAGVSNPPRGSVSAQGHELQMATNCLGPYLLTRLLEPVLTRTAESAAPGAVRIVWTGSIVVEFGAAGATTDIAQLTTPSSDQQANYTASKMGNWLLAGHFASRLGGSGGILSVAQNPGNLRTLLTRHLPRIIPVLVTPLLYHARFGAYTALWSGLSPDLRLEEDNGRYILPFGRLSPPGCPREELAAATRTREEGGTGEAAVFAEWCERRVEAFM